MPPDDVAVARPPARPERASSFGSTGWRMMRGLPRRLPMIAADLTYLRNLAYMMPAVVAVQGAAYFVQFVIAALLGPADFGIVRSVEAVLGVSVILASIGMPSLAVKCIAETDDLETRGRLLARLLLIATGAALVVSTAVHSGASWLVGASAAPYLRHLAWVVPLAACSRTALNYYQGSREIRRYSVLSASVGCGVFPLYFVAVFVSGLHGWTLARYGAEALALSAALLPLVAILRPVARLPAVYSYARLVRVGGVLSLSLVARTVLDNLGTLALVAVGAEPSQIGHYGIGALVAGALLIVPGCIANLALPGFVRRLDNPLALARVFYRTAGVTALAGLSLSMLAILLMPSVIRFLFPAYGASVLVIQVLLMTLCARALTTVSGTLLIALDQADVTLVANLLILSVGAVLMLSLTPIFGIIGAAWATVGVESTSALVYGLLARRGLSSAQSWARRSPAANGGFP